MEGSKAGNDEHKILMFEYHYRIKNPFYKEGVNIQF